MRAGLVVVALLSGAALAIQVGMNNALRARMGHPMLAALTSFLIGLVGLLVMVLAARPAMPKSSDLREVPWWAWGGGLVGAAYVTSAAAFATRLGAAAWLGLIVTGQIAASIAMDHFGLVGFARRPVTPVRILGAILLVAGVALVLWPGGGEGADPAKLR